MLRCVVIPGAHMAAHQSSLLAARDVRRHPHLVALPLRGSALWLHQWQAAATQW
jgi:hypothetical protein